MAALHRERFQVEQTGLGTRVLAQLGVVRHVWQQASADPAAVGYFQGLWQAARAWFAG